MANGAFVPTPPDILRSKSGGATNVGYDRLNRKRFDIMARSRLRHWGGTRTARNHDVRATRQGEEASGRGALFASSVSLTSPLRSEVPGKTKVATSISRSIPFHPVLIKPYVTGWNADASKSGRILRFFRRSTGREKPPRPWGWG